MLACEVSELAALVCISACELPVFPSVVESDAAREEFTVGLVTASVWFGGVTAEFSSAFTAKGRLVTNKLKRIPVLSNQNLLDDFI